MPQRLDRGMYTQIIWFGLLASGLWALIRGVENAQLSRTTDVVLSLLIVVASAVCLFASFAGTKNFLPKMSLSTIYGLEIVGLVGVCIVVGTFMVVAKLPLLEQFTMAGKFAAIIQIGSLRMIAYLAWERSKLRSGVAA